MAWWMRNTPRSRLTARWLAIVVCGIGALSRPAATQGACTSDTPGVSFVCEQAGPEDFAVLPGKQWLLTAGQIPGGALRLVDVKARTTTVVFPSNDVPEQLDKRRYPGCPGPVDAAEHEKFRAHGLYLRNTRQRVETLYMVHHGLRESVEVFDVDTTASPPTFKWVGCAIAPDKTSLNAVVGFPDGGFAATNMQTQGLERGVMQSGGISGELWEWHAATGWKKVEGSETSGANGLEISQDGKWFYIGAWGSQSFVKLSRGVTPAIKQTIPLDFRIDNLRWAHDGKLFGVGQRQLPPAGGVPQGTTVVVTIDPNSLAVKKLLEASYTQTFSVGTVAAEFGDDLWIGSTRGDRIAVFSKSNLAHGSKEHH